MLKIYVANLGKYNEGELVGEWLTLPASEEEIEELFVNIKVGHYDEDGEYIPGYYENGVIYEEPAIHAYESDIPGLEISEYSDITELNKIAEELDGLDEYETETLSAIIEATGYNLEDAVNCIDDAVFYGGDTLEDVARELVSEGCYGEAIMEVPDYYIDFEAIARDLSYDNYYEVSNGVVYVN